MRRAKNSRRRRPPRGRSLIYTIVRPGALTDDSPTGEIRLGEDLDPGEITRADTARVLATALDIEATHERTFEELAGDEPIESTLESLSSAN